MTQLALAVDADDELWTLDALPTPEAPYVEVESELIEVRSRFPSQIYSLTGQELPPRIRVRRGIAGTTKASHIQGSTLTPNYGLGGGAGAGGVTVDNQSDPPAEVTTLIAPGAVITGDEADFSALEGVQTVRLLGPFPVAFDTAAIAVGGVLLATLDPDTWIIAAWAHVTTEWNFDAPDNLNIEVAPVSDPGNSYYAATYVSDPSDNIGVQGDATVAVEAFTTGVSPTPHRAMVGTVEASRLTCRTGTAATAGTADIYALIAEPAS